MSDEIEAPHNHLLGECTVRCPRWRQLNPDYNERPPLPREKMAQSEWTAPVPSTEVTEQAEEPYLTYWLDLTALDGRDATFASDKTHAVVGLPEADWISMGRPGQITVIIKKDHLP